jgi:hypothetical protein
MGSNIRAIEVSKTGSTSLSDDTSNREIMEIQGAAPSILTFHPCLMHVCYTTSWHRASLTYGTSRPKRCLFHKDLWTAIHHIPPEWPTLFDVRNWSDMFRGPRYNRKILAFPPKNTDVTELGVSGFEPFQSPLSSSVPNVAMVYVVCPSIFFFFFFFFLNFVRF